MKPTPRFGLPVLDVSARYDATDWDSVPRCRADDVGVETTDGRWLRTEDEVTEFWLDARDHT